MELASLAKKLKLTINSQLSVHTTPYIAAFAYAEKKVLKHRDFQPNYIIF